MSKGTGVRGQSEDESVMLKAVAGMMRTAGDAANSDTETVVLMMDIARKRMLEIVSEGAQLVRLRGGRNAVRVEDVLFVTRKDPELHAQVVHFLKAKGTSSAAKDADENGEAKEVDLDDQLGEDDDEDDEEDMVEEDMVEEEGEEEDEEDEDEGGGKGKGGKGKDEEDEEDEDEVGEGEEVGEEEDMVTEEMADKKAKSLRAVAKSERKRKRERVDYMSYVYQSPLDVLEYTGIRPNVLDPKLEDGDGEESAREGAYGVVLRDIYDRFRKKRLKRYLDQSEGMGAAEYLNVDKMRKTSFVKGTPKQFRSWLGITSSIGGVAFPRAALDIVAHIGREHVIDLTTRALGIMARERKHPFAPLPQSSSSSSSSSSTTASSSSAAATTDPADAGRGGGAGEGGVFESAAALAPRHLLEAARRVRRASKRSIHLS